MVGRMDAPLWARGGKISPLTAITPPPSCSRLMTTQGDGAQRRKKGSLTEIQWHEEG